MRKVMLILLVTGAGLALSSCATTPRGPGCVRDLTGAWELVEPHDPALRQVKLLTADHFTWVTYRRATGEVIAVGGGTWSCDDAGYVETVLYATDNVARDLVGLAQHFTVERRDDLWRHQGDLTNGARVSEVWQRVSTVAEAPPRPPRSRTGERSRT